MSLAELTAVLFVVSWSPQPGTVDVLQYSTALPTTNWIAVPGPYSTNSAGEFIVPFSVRAGERRVFRVCRDWQIDNPHHQ